MESLSLRPEILCAWKALRLQGLPIAAQPQNFDGARSGVLRPGSGLLLLFAVFSRLSARTVQSRLSVNTSEGKDGVRACGRGKPSLLGVSGHLEGRDESLRSPCYSPYPVGWGAPSLFLRDQSSINMECSALQRRCSGFPGTSTEAPDSTVPLQRLQTAGAAAASTPDAKAPSEGQDSPRWPSSSTSLPLLTPRPSQGRDLSLKDEGAQAVAMETPARVGEARGWGR